MCDSSVAVILEGLYSLSRLSQNVFLIIADWFFFFFLSLSWWDILKLEPCSCFFGLWDVFGSSKPRKSRRCETGECRLAARHSQSERKVWLKCPTVLCACPSICRAQFTRGKTGHLSALCLSEMRTNRKLQSEGSWFGPTYTRETFIRGESMQNVISTSMVQISATCLVCLKHFSC